jgi:hypothetical protein
MAKRTPKVGDWIKQKSWSSFYEVKDVKSETVYLFMTTVGLEDYSINDNWIFRPITSIPLYSEEQAASFLREKGYKVEEPPKPRTRTVVAYSFEVGIIHFAEKEYFLERRGWVLPPIVLEEFNWTEGEGI